MFQRNRKRVPKYHFFICDRCGKAHLEIIGSLQEEMNLCRDCAKRILQMIDPKSTLGIDQPLRLRR